MEEIKLTKKIRKRLAREIARLSKKQYEETCMNCIKDISVMINLIAHVLGEQLTVVKFLETIAEKQGGPKMTQFYLDLFEI